MAAFVFCFPHPDRASPTVCSKQKTRSKAAGAIRKTCGEGGIACGDLLREGLKSKANSAALRAPFFIPVRFGEQVRPAAGNEKCPR